MWDYIYDYTFRVVLKLFSQLMVFIVYDPTIFAYVDVIHILITSKSNITYNAIIPANTCILFNRKIWIGILAYSVLCYSSF